MLGIQNKSLEDAARDLIAASTSLTGETPQTKRPGVEINLGMDSAAPPARGDDSGPGGSSPDMLVGPSPTSCQPIGFGRLLLLEADGSGRRWAHGQRTSQELLACSARRGGRPSSVSRRKLTTQQALLRHSSAGGFLGGRRSFQGHSTSGPCSRRLLALGLSGRIVVRTWPSPHGRAHAVLLAARAPCAGQGQAFYPPWSEDISGSLLTSTA